MFRAGCQALFRKQQTARPRFTTLARCANCTKNGQKIWQNLRKKNLPFCRKMW
jgi:hypothetical protein